MSTVWEDVPGADARIRQLPDGTWEVAVLHPRTCAQEALASAIREPAETAPSVRRALLAYWEGMRNAGTRPCAYCGHPSWVNLSLSSEHMHVCYWCMTLRALVAWRQEQARRGEGSAYEPFPDGDAESWASEDVSIGYMFRPRRIRDA